METISTTSYASRILPYSLSEAVRLCERLRCRCGGLLLGEDMSLRFLEHVSINRPTHVRLRDSADLTLPASVALLAFDEDWCQIRVEPRIRVAAMGGLQLRVRQLVDAAADGVAVGVLGHFEPTAR